jgi:hypothetical protein
MTTIDDAILNVARDNWRKVAFFIGSVQRDLADSLSDTQVAGRVEALVREGHLEAQGDLSRWRYREVRLPRRRSD